MKLVVDVNMQSFDESAIGGPECLGEVGDELGVLGHGDFAEHEDGQTVESICHMLTG